MALYCNVSKAYKSLVVPSCTLVKYIHKNFESRSVLLEVNSLDDFTSQLIQKQSSKWENIQAKSKQLSEQRKTAVKIFDKSVSCSNISLESWSIALEEKNIEMILRIVDFCVETDRPPPKDLICKITQVLAESGQSNAIVRLKNLCGKHFPKFALTEFDLCLAEAFWNEGDITKSLDLFMHVYSTNKISQRRINATLKYLFLNIIKSRSEAVLLMALKFCEQLHKKHQDVFLLSVLWQMCFLSEWFADQNIAFDLIEANSELRKVVLLRMPFLVSIALSNHQTDVVYRLLEFLLRYQLQTEYSNVLQCLFDYKSK